MWKTGRENGSTLQLVFGWLIVASLALELKKTKKELLDLENIIDARLKVLALQAKETPQANDQSSRAPFAKQSYYNWIFGSFKSPIKDGLDGLDSSSLNAVNADPKPASDGDYY